MSTLTAAASKLGLSLSPEKPPPAADEKEPALRFADRPETIESFVGQDRVRVQLRMMLKAVRERNARKHEDEPTEVPGHVLLAGPSGTGKTTLAHIIAGDTGGQLRIATASAVRTPKNLGRWLAKACAGDVLFIDEMHGLPILAEELLYTAMEDGRIEVIVGDGTKSDVVPVNLAPFTLVGCTTKLGKISEPARQRFELIAELEFYTTDQLAEIVLGFALKEGIDIDEDACLDIARRARGTTRVAKNLYRRCRDYAQVCRDGSVDVEVVGGAMTIAEIDSLGLTMTDQMVLLALCDDLKGGPCGLNNLATATGVDPSTVCDNSEPFLIRAGLMKRMPRGRVATKAAYEHLNLNVPLDLGW